ncbi:putative membrane-anchored protein [Microbacterium testaceum]|nr:putative membrane-anchored protein [Microbacterium testaceum]
MSENARPRRGLWWAVLILGIIALVAAVAGVVFMVSGSFRFGTIASVIGCAGGGVACLSSAWSALKASEADRTTAA